MEQRTPEWFEARKGKVTGSRVGAILGLSPFQKPKDVLRAMVRDYHGAESEFTGNPATTYGQQFEAFAQGDFELETGLDVDQVGLVVHPSHEWLAASPDGLIDHDAVLEIKCPFGKRDSAEFASIIDQPHYYAQVQIEMYCTGRKRCHFYQWSSQGSRLETVDFSMTWIESNLHKLREFYDWYLSELDNEAHLTDLVQTKEATSLAERYKAAKAAMESAKAEMDAAKKELIALADGKKTNVSGLLVYPIERKGSVKYAQVVKDHLPDLDLSEYMGASTKTWGIK